MSKLNIPKFGEDLDPKSKHRKVQITVEFPSGEPGIPPIQSTFSCHWSTWCTFVGFYSSKRSATAATLGIGEQLPGHLLGEIIAMYRSDVDLPVVMVDRNSLLMSNELAASKIYIAENYRFSAKMIK